MSEQNPTEVPSFKKTRATSTFLNLVLKSFAVLALLGFIFFAIYWTFGRMAFEDHSRSELYGQVMRGQADVRRMAALEWASRLQKADTSADLEAQRSFLPSEEETIVLSQELKSLQASARPDVQLIAGILGVLAHSYSARAQTAMRDFLLLPLTAEWSQAQVQAVIGLSRRAPEDSENLAVMENLVKTNLDPSVRKAIAYGLGFAGEGESDTETWTRKQNLLETLMRDQAPDVRWNSSFSVLRLGMGSEAASKQLADLVEELASDVGSDLTPAREAELVQKRSTYLEALKLSQKIEATEPLFEKLSNHIKNIANKHPDLKIRQGAKDALKSSE